MQALSSMHSVDRRYSGDRVIDHSSSSDHSSDHSSNRIEVEVKHTSFLKDDTIP